MISAKIICDSLSPEGVRITTFELEYPRFIHSELMTHRVFSRNSASSRAIPVNTMLDTIAANPATPVHWGKNQPGMQAKEELDQLSKIRVQSLWNKAKDTAIEISYQMFELGAHKQVANRITEPFQHMKVVMTTTEYENWDWLRRHPDADPTINALAVAMHNAREKSIPFQLRYNEWHIPYVGFARENSFQQFYDEFGKQIGISEALMISASCCAQVSYRKQDSSLEKAEVIYKRLIESEPCHASPVEHQAKTFDKNFQCFVGGWPKGITHLDREGNYWSGNFRGFIQHRQLIPNNAKHG